MKVLFTGGGTGGHFYPIIAIAQALNDLAQKEHLATLKLYYMSDDPYNERLLFDNGITFVKVSTGKMRTYASGRNIIDMFKTFFALFRAFFLMFSIYPDVVVGKGGYASFPALFAARLLGIPVIIHESDSVPGRANKWAAKFARKIAISYPEAAEYLPKKKTALTGNPIRKEIMTPIREGAYELLNLEEGIPTIFIVGGSQGAQRINEVVIQTLPDLLPKYQIIHQVGKRNFDYVKNISKVLLEKSDYGERYKVFDYLNDEAMRMAAGVADLIVSRAGSAIFEIAIWGVPSIIIPITESNGDHQRKNAYSYARAGACEVIEEKNLTPHLFVSEINRLMEDENQRKKMSEAARAFARTDAAEKIAEQIIAVLLEHQK